LRFRPTSSSNRDLIAETEEQWAMAPKARLALKVELKACIVQSN
jgi:hypothetical protein